ncbi:MAG: insulinase family protein [Acidobacteria bacterium]|nr:insulinase family protein [Acidobacteriota bacterium]
MTNQPHLRFSRALGLAALLGLAISLQPVAAVQTHRQRQAPAAPSKPAVKQRDAEAWRQQPPAPRPARPFVLPALSEVKLDNGLALILIEDHRVPMVTLTLGLPVGSATTGVNQIALAEATASLLNDGAGQRSSEALARAVESLGGQLAASTNDDYTEINATVIAENLEAMLDLFGDVVLRPTFPETEVALYKKNRIEGLTVQRQEPSFLVSERFNLAIYGAHPYAISAPTPAAVAALERHKIEAFYQANYRPDGATLVVTGDFAATKIAAKLRALFGHWQAASGTPQKFPDLVEPTSRRIYLIDRPGSEQADFRIGNLAVARADEDYFALLVANAILGDGTSSRLFLNIREQKGYSYDVSSAVHAPQRRGTFFGASQTRTAVTLAAIREMLKEFTRLRNERVSEKDLQNARNYLNGGFSLSLSTQGGVSDALMMTRMLGLAPAYLEHYRERIAAVTAEQVQQVARQYIRPEQATIVVVGDAAQLRKSLATLGKVEVFATTGKLVKK